MLSPLLATMLVLQLSAAAAANGNAAGSERFSWFSEAAVTDGSARVAEETGTKDGSGVSLSPSGPSVDVWGAVETFRRCGSYIASVPDIPARAYNDDKGTTHMIVGSTAYNHMNGPSILNVTRECQPTFNKTGDSNPAHFAANEFVDSPISFPNGTVVALVHTEYPGGSYNLTGPNPPMCAGLAPDGSGRTLRQQKNYPYCWTVSIGSVISHDWGKSWQHTRPPPDHLIAAVPYKYNADQLAYGWGDPSNIVKHPKDGHYYVAVWNRNKVGLQEPGICMMRTNNLMDPRSWRAWDGKAYTKSMVSPYTMEAGTESDHVCTVTNLPAGTCIPIKGKERGCQAAGIVWSTYLEKFVVTLGCGASFSWATSDDLITWSTPQKIDILHGMPANETKMVVAMNYPTLMDPTAPTAFGDNNYYTVGQHPYLFWASIGHSPESDGRHQWATPMTFQK